MTTKHGEAEEASPLFSLPIAPATSPDIMLEHMASSLRRGLPTVQRCRPHDRTLSIAAGGPSLADTYTELDGYIGAVNGSLGFLLERNIVPNACAVMDPGEHMADVVARDERVNYFIASICHPKLFDKLRGCHVVIWNPLGMPDKRDEQLLSRLVKNWWGIGGGTTIGLRWLMLGHFLGFRTFKLHGLDSSFRETTHAYPDRFRGESVIVNGRPTKLNFMCQLVDFEQTIHRLSMPDMGPVEIEVFGEGLLQGMWRHRCSTLFASMQATISGAEPNMLNTFAAA